MTIPNIASLAPPPGKNGVNAEVFSRRNDPPAVTARPAPLQTETAEAAAQVAPETVGSHHIILILPLRPGLLAGIAVVLDKKFRDNYVIELKANDAGQYEGHIVVDAAKADLNTEIGQRERIIKELRRALCQDADSRTIRFAETEDEDLPARSLRSTDQSEINLAKADLAVHIFSVMVPHGMGAHGKIGNLVAKYPQALRRFKSTQIDGANHHEIGFEMSNLEGLVPEYLRNRLAGQLLMDPAQIRMIEPAAPLPPNADAKLQATAEVPPALRL